MANVIARKNVSFKIKRAYNSEILSKFVTLRQNMPWSHTRSRWVFSEYQLSKLFPKDFKSSMPTIEELEKGLKSNPK